MSNNLAEKIKESVKLRDVMEFYGVKFNSRGFAKCPFHTEKTASLSIKNERYKCFGCGAYGSVIDFVMEYHGLKFMQAVVKIDTDFQLGLTGHRQTYRESIQRGENRRIEDAKRKFEEDIRLQYLSLCDVHAILFRRLIAGEDWLSEIVNKLDMILDDFTGEEARAWKMIMT